MSNIARLLQFTPRHWVVLSCQCGAYMRSRCVAYVCSRCVGYLGPAKSLQNCNHLVDKQGIAAVLMCKVSKRYCVLATVAHCEELYGGEGLF